MLCTLHNLNGVAGIMHVVTWLGTHIELAPSTIYFSSKAYEVYIPKWAGEQIKEKY